METSVGLKTCICTHTVSALKMWMSLSIFFLPNKRIISNQKCALIFCICCDDAFALERIMHDYHKNALCIDPALIGNVSSKMNKRIIELYICANCVLVTEKKCYEHNNNNENIVHSSVLWRCCHAPTEHTALETPFY